MRRSASIGSRAIASSISTIPTSHVRSSSRGQQRE
ncbi:hypothetical protein BDSB_19840 [Burkholderia dolosa PC543]|nr:hypothetical protein BDSB_19840 [Burkholderia dolosa PC543]